MSHDRARVVSCSIRVSSDTLLCRVCRYSLCAAPWLARGRGSELFDWDGGGGGGGGEVTGFSLLHSTSLHFTPSVHVHAHAHAHAHAHIRASFVFISIPIFVASRQLEGIAAAAAATTPSSSFRDYIPCSADLAALSGVSSAHVGWAVLCWVGICVH
jgi:hypothetical protein